MSPATEVPAPLPISREVHHSGAVHAFRRTQEDRRLIESIRAVLAIVAGLLLLDTPTTAQGTLSVAVLAFGAYAGILLWLAANSSSLPTARILHWVDACWFLLFVALAHDAGVRYFLFLFFPVLFASWRRGFGESAMVATFSGLLTMVIFGLLTPEITWARLFSLPLSLLITGPMVAMLTRDEAVTQQGFTFAASLVESIDPRRGFDGVMPAVIERIAKEFGATGAVLVVRTFDGNHRAMCWEPEHGCAKLSDAAAAPLTERLFRFPIDQAFAYRTRTRWWQRESLRTLSVSGPHLESTQGDRMAIAAIATLIGHADVLSVPLFCRSIGTARLVLSGDTVALKPQVLEILIHVIEQISPTIENAFLLERLANEAVDTERARIGRDLHDSAIQPYIGLKFAIEAVARMAGPENPVSEDLDRLLEMTNDELRSMREVVSGLRGAPGKGGALLSSAVQRQADRFAQLFGIQVSVSIDRDLPISRRIAGELFHLVAEGLSNIRRHTRARTASIAVDHDSEHLTLRIRNEHPDRKIPADFFPRSLTERAAALGGATTTDSDIQGTTVTVTIPLEQPVKGHSA